MRDAVGASVVAIAQSVAAEAQQLLAPLLALDDLDLMLLLLVCRMVLKGRWSSICGPIDDRHGRVLLLLLLLLLL